MSHVESNPFRQASLDSSLNILELFSLNVKHSPSHPIFVYELNGVVQSLTWRHFVNAIDHGTRVVTDSISANREEEAKPPVIGILAASDAITHYTLGFSILRAGYQAFLISTRNSPAAIAHLLSETKCYNLFVSEDAAMQGICATATTALAGKSHSLSVHKMPHYEDLYVKDGVPPVLPPYKRDLNAPAFILHSSGSTSFPKPVYVSHLVFMQWIRLPSEKLEVYIQVHQYSNDMPDFSEGDLSHDIMAIHPLPMSHAMGLIMTTWSASTGMVLACFPPVFPPVQPTPDTVMRSLISTKSTLVFSVPSFVEHWAENPENLTRLSQLKAVTFAGAPLSRAVGNLLAANDVPMVHIYGATEFGGGTEFMPKTPQREDWEYILLAPHLNYVLVPQDDEDLYELVFLENENHRPCVFNVFINGQRGYATNDLLVRHPTNPRLWKIHGRKDDQLMLSTGEKTNPGPIETTLCRDPRILHAIMFGRGREINGVIVQPQPEYVFDPSDAAALAAFRNHIWPTVEKANAVAPSHSRLFKEMVIVTPPSKPFDLTSKGTPRRGFVLTAYGKEIEQAYEAVQESSQSDVVPPSHWDENEILKFTREIVHMTMREEVADDADVFQQGCDSLQATWIRNTIRHALRHSSNGSVRNISQSLVYENPSISALASYITKLTSETSSMTPPLSTEEDTQAMQCLVGELSQGFKHSAMNQPGKQSGDVILVTGTTGALGSHLLAQLIVLPETFRVYAINRRARNDVSLHERQRSSFEDRGLDSSLLASPKLVLVQTDISLPNLGLTESLFYEIQNSITHIVHNAWTVNFKISLPSFKPLVQSVRNLIDLALCSPLPSPPAFVFMSSVGVLRNWTSSNLVPEAPVDAKVAVGSGYSESKWVTEALLNEAARSTLLRPTIVRINQLSGSANGAWNPSDSIPAIVRSGQVLGCLPDRNDNIAWLPADVAAASIIDIRSSRMPYIHLQNPNQTPWHKVFNVFSVRLGIKLVPYAEWLSQLEAQTESLNSGPLDVRGALDNPAVLLLHFYQSLKEDRGPITAPMDMTQTLQRCRPLGNPELKSVFSEEEVGKWISYWRRKELLEQ